MTIRTLERPVPPTNRGQRFAAEPLTVAELAQLRDRIPRRSSSGKRMRALVAVMYGAGLRLQETLDLMPRDIDLDGCQVRVRDGKGGKARVSGLLHGTCADLQLWMEERERLGMTRQDPVFAAYSVGKVGKPLDPREVRKMLSRAGTRAGIDKRVHPHGLRHSHAVRMQELGLPLTTIQAQLGHASLDSTATYLAKLTNAEAVAAVSSLPAWTAELEGLL